ncbi:unnamed protein product [Urochloa decumbens]|uniref:DUF4220 domain-containing protein n=1 Tax=Urochloa decumbens TaxID=240449 RepID=A0ABC9AU09_9POAL
MDPTCESDSHLEGMKYEALLAAVAIHAPLLIILSSHRHRSNHSALRFVLLGVSAMYFPLMSYVLSYLPSYISYVLKKMKHRQWEDTGVGLAGVLLSLILIQFLKSKVDMAALAVTAVTSPVAGDNIDSLKVRPSMESLIYSFWVAGLVIYSLLHYFRKDVHSIAPIIAPLWILGACRMVLRFAAFQRATGSFALGRNVELIDGYMAHLQQAADQGQLPAAVPRLIVTGERNEDVEETPLGYRVKSSALGAEHGSLITLDRVWSHTDPDLLKFKDLCLSFALFKCLRRRFAGYQLAEAGSRWAFRFVLDGMLGLEGDHERIFQVIADELLFARGFYYSPLPVASLGALPAALHFFLSSLISALFCFVALVLVPTVIYLPVTWPALVLALVNASAEIVEMVASVRSNWTKISIISHYVRCQRRCLQKIFSCLLRCKSQRHWKDDMRQVDLLKPSHFGKPSWAGLFKRLFLPGKNRHKPVIKVPPAVKAAVLASFRSSGGQLTSGTSTVRRRRRRETNSPDITWACLGSGEVTTTTDVLLVWHVATSIFETWSSSSTLTDTMVVATSLSRYCAYLVAQVPDLLPENSAWTKRQYEAVTKGVEEASKPSDAAVPQSGVYGHLIDSFSADTCHEVLNKGSRLGKQLVEEAERRRSGGEDGDEGAVWELLAEFWSEMVLYLAPSNNVRGHIEALQRSGELITLLWALLLHAGITSRPPVFNPIACVLVSTGDPESIDPQIC